MGCTAPAALRPGEVAEMHARSPIVSTVVLRGCLCTLTRVGN